jgi:hypothetical protein
VGGALRSASIQGLAGPAGTRSALPSARFGFARRSYRPTSTWVLTLRYRLDRVFDHHSIFAVSFANGRRTTTVHARTWPSDRACLSRMSSIRPRRSIIAIGFRKARAWSALLFSAVCITSTASNDARPDRHLPFPSRFARVVMRAELCVPPRLRALAALSGDSFGDPLVCFALARTSYRAPIIPTLTLRYRLDRVFDHHRSSAFRFDYRLRQHRSELVRYSDGPLRIARTSPPAGISALLTLRYRLDKVFDHHNRALRQSSQYRL